MKPFTLKLITPSGIVFEGEVAEVSLPTPEGQITILADHKPIIVQVAPGELKLVKSGKDSYLATEGGVAYVSKNFLKILADTAESAESLDLAKIEEAKKKAEHLKNIATNEEEFAHAEALIEKQLAKIKFVKKRQHH